MRFYIKLNDKKDKDILSWLDNVDKEARPYMIKLLLRVGLKNFQYPIISKDDESLNDKEEEKVSSKLDKMF